MGSGGANGFSNSKKAKARRAQSKRESAEDVQDDCFGDPDADEPPLAAPARKRASGKRSRTTRHTEPTAGPPLRGAPLEKHQRKLMHELSPEEQVARRERNRAYDKTSYLKKRAQPPADLPAEDSPASIYAVKKNGTARKSQQAVYSAKARLVGGVAVAVQRIGDSPAAQGQLVQDALESDKLKEAAAHVRGFATTEQMQVALYHQQQLARMLERARETIKKKKGRTNDDRRSFCETACVLVASSPQKQSPRGVPVPSLNARARALSTEHGFSESTAKRLLTAASEKRKKLSEREEGVSWSRVQRRKGHSKVSKELRAELHEWVLAHPRIVASPISNDTLLVKNKETGKKERVGKLLREISIRELHNDLIRKGTEGGGLVAGLASARDATGKVLISDTALRYLLPVQLKPMTERHKMMCGCEVCIVPDSMQQTLNAWRVRHKSKLLADAMNLPRGSDAAKVWLRMRP
jgi:hypothetical protein